MLISLTARSPAARTPTKHVTRVSLHTFTPRKPSSANLNTHRRHRLLALLSRLGALDLYKPYHPSAHARTQTLVLLCCCCRLYLLPCNHQPVCMYHRLVLAFSLLRFIIPTTHSLTASCPAFFTYTPASFLLYLFLVFFSCLSPSLSTYLHLSTGYQTFLRHHFHVLNLSRSKSCST